jgi:hypothetical protein
LWPIILVCFCSPSGWSLVPISLPSLIILCLCFMAPTGSPPAAIRHLYCPLPTSAPLSHPPSIAFPCRPWKWMPTKWTETPITSLTLLPITVTSLRRTLCLPSRLLARLSLLPAFWPPCHIVATLAVHVEVQRGTTSRRQMTTRSPRRRPAYTATGLL